MILDFGCGAGPLWTQKEEQVIGIDINRRRLKVARNRIQVVCCDGRFLPFRDHVFRRVIADSVLEHIQGYWRALAEVRRVLSEEGRCTILQPVDNDPLFFLARRVAGSWNQDKIYSKFTSGHLLRHMSGPFKIHSVNYIPNSPMAGVFGFLNRKIPRILSSLDRTYVLFCQTTGIFHWEVVIEASPVGYHADRIWPIISSSIPDLRNFSTQSSRTFGEVAQ
jgi:SAM-dependent methyltransferase